MSGSSLSSAEVAQRARSNLAFSLGCLSEARKRDMISFYAFCRLVDDIADDPDTPAASKTEELERWRQCVRGALPPFCPVLEETVVLPEKYAFPAAWLEEIIDGVASDIEPARYATYEDLQRYCYKVASVVGLVSSAIFGCRQAASRDYAIELGYALQLTNIMRDVGSDARENGRIYLPLDDLKRFGVSEADILAGCSSPAFERLMDFQYERARQHYERAEQLLPPSDRHRLLPARMMAQVYAEILEKLHRQRYPVFTQRCRLHPLRKLWLLLRYSAQARWERCALGCD